ncbi:RNA polymerase subunit sigma-24 [Paenibacillus cisolokensis]|uniref:RNA polymerase subunit sigma-24 n=1 Tax=Paenibacillus cisolokensis TaxID=1658519 RepID=UPI003D27090D
MTQAIEQLTRYRQMKARIQVLSNYSVGAGITVSRLNEDDQLQELHRKLRGLPTYMYLNKRELELETAAHAYLDRYPVGVKAQKRAIPTKGADQEDTELLQELRRKIQKVIAARGYDIRDDVDQIIERLAELQDLQAEVNQIDTVLDALEQHKSEYARLIRKHLIDGATWEETAREMSLSKSAFYRWREKAIEEYEKLAIC